METAAGGPISAFYERPPADCRTASGLGQVARSKSAQGRVGQTCYGEVGSHAFSTTDPAGFFSIKQTAAESPRRPVLPCVKLAGDPIPDLRQSFSWISPFVRVVTLRKPRETCQDGGGNEAVDRWFRLHNVGGEGVVSRLVV